MDVQTLLLSLLFLVSAATPGCNRQDNIRPKTVAADTATCCSAPAPIDPPGVRAA